MSETVPSSSSEGSDTTLINQDEFDVYLQAVFGYIEPQGYDIVSPCLRVIHYSEDSPDFWNYLRRFIRFASKYQLLLNEDLVMVIQDGANIYDEIVSYLQKARVKYKYLAGPNNCFILTMLSKTHEISSNTVGQYILSESELGTHVSPGGSYELYLRLHSMSDICSEVFKDPYTISNAQKVVDDKNRNDLGIKLPDYSAFPKYLPLIRLIQGAPNIPTFMIETGMSDQMVKVEVDCISIILGVRFNVESVVGIDLRMNQLSEELGSIGFIVFDVSVDAMSRLLNKFESPSDKYKKALVAIVLKRKAQFKLDEVEAIRQLKECIDCNGDYETVCNSIAKQYRQAMKHDRLRHLVAPRRPKKRQVKRVLNDFKFETAKLKDEERDYRNLIKRCGKASGYLGGKELLPDTIREAEAFVMQQLYERRKVQTVTEEVQRELILPCTALSSTNLCEKKKISLSSDTLERCFDEISNHCTKSALEECEVKLKTQWEHLREGYRAPVALLNRPGAVSDEVAIRHFEQLYENKSEVPLITTQLKHWTTKGIKAQLKDWNIPPDGSRYVLLIKFLDMYADSNDSPPTPSTEPPLTPETASNLRKQIKKRKLSSSGSSQIRLPPNISDCLNTVPRYKAKKLRMLLLQAQLDELLLVINDDEIALQGLKKLFQEDFPIVRHFFSFPESIIHPSLRFKATNSC